MINAVETLHALGAASNIPWPTGRGISAGVALLGRYCAFPTLPFLAQVGENMALEDAWVLACTG